MKAAFAVARRKLALPASIPVFLSLAQPVYAQAWDGGWHAGWGHMFFGSFMMLLLWGGLVILLVLAVRWLGGGGARGGERNEAGNRALEILEEGFARGEIDKEEFEERRRLLSR